MPSPEKRIDPEDGKSYTFEELKAYYKGTYTHEQTKSYWDQLEVDEPDFSKIPNKRRTELTTRIETFVASSESALNFETRLNGFERMFVHHAAEQMGLTSESFGAGKDRYISVVKPPAQEANRQEEPDFSKINEKKRNELMHRLEEFKTDGARSTMDFETRLSGFERLFVHHTAQKMGLVSESHGEGSNRYISVAKPSDGCSSFSVAKPGGGSSLLEQPQDMRATQEEQQRLSTEWFDAAFKTVTQRAIQSLLVLQVHQRPQTRRALEAFVKKLCRAGVKLYVFNPRHVLEDLLASGKVMPETAAEVDGRLCNAIAPTGAADAVPPSKWPSNDTFLWRIFRDLESTPAGIAQQICARAAVLKKPSASEVVKHLLSPDGLCSDHSSGKLKYSETYEMPVESRFANVMWEVPPKMPPAEAKRLCFNVKEALHLAALRGGDVPTPEYEKVFARLWIKHTKDKERILEPDAISFMTEMREAGYAFKRGLNADCMKHFESSSGCPLLAFVLSCTDTFFKPDDWADDGDLNGAGAKKLIHKAIEKTILAKHDLKVGSPVGRALSAHILSKWNTYAGLTSLRMPINKATSFAQRLTVRPPGEREKKYLDELSTNFAQMDDWLPEFKQFGGVPFLGLVRSSGDLSHWLEVHVP